MSKWEKVRLGEVCEINPTKKQNIHLYENSDVSFIPMSEVSENGDINPGIHKPFSEVSSGFSYFLEGDVLFAKITPCMENGKGAIARGLKNRLGVGSTEFHILRPNKNYILSDWIFRLTTSKKFRNLAERNMTGTAGQKRVPKSFLENVIIPLPPLEAQKQIASTLDAVSELLTMRKQQLAELDELIKSVFYEMLGDPIKNEKQWDIGPLGNYLKIVGGYAFRSDRYSKTGTPLVKIGNINSGYFKENNISFYQLDTSLEKYILYPNDLVISLTGTVGKDDYANVCKLPDKYPMYLLNQRVAKLEIGSSINRNFLIYLLRNSGVKSQLTGKNRGVRQANISNNDLASLSVPIPPLSVQEKFSVIVESIESQSKDIRKSIDELQSLFLSLQAKYFE